MTNNIYQNVKVFGEFDATSISAETLDLIKNSISVSLLDSAYPVGAIYISTNNVSPSSLFGGTWTRIQDQFLLAAGSTYSVGETGGEATHTLTVNEMPSHKHGMSAYFYQDEIGSDSSSASMRSGEFNTSESAFAYTSLVGGGAAHNNMPPYLAVYVWKRTA